MKACSVADCAKDHYAKGCCRKHYAKANRIAKRKPCLAPNCTKQIQHTSGYCTKHRKRLEKGQPLNGTLIGWNKGSNNPRWNGGRSQYPNHYEFKKARREKLRQAKYKCEECGKRANVVHHLDGSKTNHALENLKALCNGCHMNIYHKDHLGRKPLFGNLSVREMSEKTGLTPAVIRKYFLVVRPKIEAMLSEVKQ